MVLKKKILRLLFILEIIIFLIFYFGGPSGLSALFEIKKSNKRVLEEIYLLNKDVDQLQAEVYKWKNEDFCKEKIAREQLQMARPGDEIFYIVN